MTDFADDELARLIRMADALVLIGYREDGALRKGEKADEARRDLGALQMAISALKGVRHAVGRDAARVAAYL